MSKLTSAVVGGCVGGVVMCARLANACVAPVSYPVLGVVGAMVWYQVGLNMVQVKGDTRVLATVVGTPVVAALGVAYGCAMVPLAPLDAVTTPLAIPACAALGVMVASK